MISIVYSKEQEVLIVTDKKGNVHSFYVEAWTLRNIDGSLNLPEDVAEKIAEFILQ